MLTAMIEAKLQHCNWARQQEYSQTTRRKRYLAEERKEVMNDVWWYIQSAAEIELVDN